MIRDGLAAMLVWLAGTCPAGAQTLAIGAATLTGSVDPHFQVGFQNQAPLSHVYETLFARDERMQLRPGLAEHWEQVAPTGLRVRLRAGVRFHDGQPLTARDVAHSLARAGNVPNSPASFAAYTRAIAQVDVIDELTLEIRTHEPRPALASELATIMIVSHLRAAATTASFNDGRDAIGTGPYRFVEWVPGQRLTLERHDGHWGPRPEWSRIEFRLIANDAARVAALLSGTLDLIEVVPPNALESVRERRDLTIFTTALMRVIYMSFNHVNQPSAHVTGPTGAALPANPLSDARVRQAISLAIDRRALVEQILDGQAQVANQVQPPGSPGTFADLPPAGFDPVRARALLAAAGYADGFSMTLLGANARYGNDQQVQQAIAQMLARIGVRTRVESVPAAVAMERGARREFGMFLWGLSSETGEIVDSLRSLMASTEHPRGRGFANRGLYANLEVDAWLGQAEREIDPARRLAVIRNLAARAIDDTVFLTLYHPNQNWAARAGITLSPRGDGYTLATAIRRAR